MSRLMKSAVAAVAVLVATQAAPAAISISEDSLSRPGYVVVTFSGSGTDSWLVPGGVSSVEVLVVGGGGGGGRKGGGGGGGGFYYTPAHGLFGGFVNVTVGAGGAGSGVNYTQTAGGQSEFDGLIAYGGGIGDPAGTTFGGASGGNNQGDAGIPGTGTFGAGGYGAGPGSGDGGAGGGWANLFGGNGKQSAITGTNLYYGGGGGGWYDGGNNAGGLGGGGQGSIGGGAGVSGTDGLGGGGGDARDSGSGGDGGDGIVIIAYAIPEPATFGMLGAAAIAMLLRRRFEK